jgi:hypothetical protein
MFEIKKTFFGGKNIEEFNLVLFKNFYLEDDKQTLTWA